MMDAHVAKKGQEPCEAPRDPQSHPMIMGGRNSEGRGSRRAAGMGYQDAHARRTESALDPLRSRDDFLLLMRDQTFPAEPFTTAR